MYEDRTEAKLDYRGLLLNHLNRISMLASFLQGSPTTENLNVDFKEVDKLETFAWQIRILDAFIADELKDKAFEESIGEIKKLGEDVESLKHWEKLLHNIINLLARKDLLYEKSAVAKLLKGKGGSQEEWEI